MKYLKKLMLLSLVLTLVASSYSVAFTQGEQGPDDHGNVQVFLPVVGGSSANADEELVVSETISADSQAAALEFWTPERIAAAPALPLMVQTTPVEVGAASLAELEESGAVFHVSPSSADAGADDDARAAYPADWVDTGDSAEELAALEAGLQAEASDQPADVDGTRGIYTSYINNYYSSDQRIYPHRWVGRLSFTTPNGTSYCTATAISKNHIVTAAHCVFDTPSRNRWYGNKVFTPAYRSGSAPYGTFPTTGCTMLRAWRDLSGSYSINTWARHDVAVCNVGTNSSGKTLNSAVGWAGRSWNYGYTRHVFNIGYAFRNYANAVLWRAGRYQRLCAAETFRQATDVRGMGCSWGGGVSGGPWIDHRSLSATAWGTNGYWPGRVSGYVTGVNSGIFIGQQNIYGARFSSNNIVKLCNATGC